MAPMASSLLSVPAVVGLLVVVVGIVGCSSGDASPDFANFGRGVITSESPHATSVNPFPFLILNLCQLNRCHLDRPATSDDDNHRLNVDKGRRQQTHQYH